MTTDDAPPKGRTSATELFYNNAWERWGEMIRYSPAPRLRRTRLLNWVAPLQPESLLDVGCGNGEFLLQARNQLPATLFTGVDVSDEVIQSNQQALPDITFAPLDLNDGPRNQRYDVVTCMEVVEHCDDYEKSIQYLADMTGKYLLITVPCGPLFEIDRRVGHVKHFSEDEIVFALEAADLQVERVERWGFPFFNLYKHLINLWPDTMCEAFLSDQSYTLKKKAISLVAYAAFRMSLPFWGYQLFAVARRV